MPPEIDRQPLATTPRIVNVAGSERRDPALRFGRREAVHRDDFVATTLASHDLDVASSDAEHPRHEIDERPIRGTLYGRRRQSSPEPPGTVGRERVRPGPRNDPDAQDDRRHCMRKAICCSVCTRKLWRNMMPMKTTIGEKSMPPAKTGSACRIR